MDLLYLTDGIRYIPHLHRVQHPVHFLIAPAAYLYVRALLRNERNFRRHDWVHALPFLLHAGELMPLFLSSTAGKLYWIDQIQATPDLIAQLPEGLLPAYWHLYIKAGIGLIYMYLQWGMVLQFNKAWVDLPPHREQVKWLRGYTLSMALLFASVIVALAFDFSSMDAFLTARLFLFAINLVILFYLLFNPIVLYGLPFYKMHRVQSAREIEPLVLERTSIISESQQCTYAEHIENFMARERPYLQTNFNMIALANALGIPRHHISACINQHFEVNFNDFVNQYRIRYLQKHINEDQWRQLTLEGVGQEVGFNSRTTFYKAFKKFLGQTPSAYRKQLLESHQLGAPPTS